MVRAFVPKARFFDTIGQTLVVAALFPDASGSMTLMDAPPLSPADEELVTNYMQGDRSALEELVRRHRDLVYRLCLRQLGSAHEAEDATQEVFLSLMRKVDRFDGRSRFTTWLYRVTVNRCLDLARSAGRERAHRAMVGMDVDADDGRQDPLAGLPAPGDVETEVLARSDVAQVLAALETVREEYRAAVLLCDMEGLRYEEIADILGVPLGTVRSRISRGRAAVVAALVDQSVAGGHREQVRE